MKWRAATAEDYPGIQQCHHSLEAELGLELDLPAFDAPAILSWLVADRAGEIVQFAALERLVEFRMAGCDREALKELMTLAPEIMRNTKAAGVRFIHVCVPPEVEKRIARKLKKVGIHRSTSVLYAADLR
jgi:hypothetical protein